MAVGQVLALPSLIRGVAVLSEPNIRPLCFPRVLTLSQGRSQLFPHFRRTHRLEKSISEANLLWPLSVSSTEVTTVGKISVSVAVRTNKTRFGFSAHIRAYIYTRDCSKVSYARIHTSS